MSKSRIETKLNFSYSISIPYVVPISSENYNTEFHVHAEVNLLTTSTEGKVWVFYDAKAKKQSKPLSLVHAQIVVLSALKDDVNRFFIWTPGWKDWKSLGEFLNTEQSYFARAEPAVPTADQFANPPINQHSQSDSFSEKPKNSQIANSKEENELNPHDPMEAISSTLSASTREGSFTDVQLSNDVETIGHQARPDFNVSELDNLQQPKMLEDKTQEFHSSAHSSDLTKTVLNNDDFKNKRSAERLNLKIEVIIMNKLGQSFRSFSKNISLGGTLVSARIPDDYLNTILDVIIVNKFEPDQANKRVALKGRVLGILGDKTSQNRIIFEQMSPKIRNKLNELLAAYLDKKDKGQKKKSA